MKRKYLLLIAKCWIAVSALPFPVLASDATLPIIKFFDGGTKTERGMRSAWEQERAKDPAVAEVVNWMFSHLDVKELELHLALVLDKFLSPAEIESWATYIKSDAGVATARIIKEYPSIVDVNAAINRMPAQERGVTLRFFNSSAMSKAATAINSPEAHRMSVQYGEELGCKYYEHERPDLLPRLRQLGKCTVGKP